MALALHSIPMMWQSQSDLIFLFPAEIDKIRWPGNIFYVLLYMPIFVYIWIRMCACRVCFSFFSSYSNSILIFTLLNASSHIRTRTFTNIYTLTHIYVYIIWIILILFFYYNWVIMEYSSTGAPFCPCSVCVYGWLASWHVRSKINSWNNNGIWI